MSEANARRVFVFEYLTGVGALEAKDLPAALLPMGAAMRDAMAGDLLRVPGCEVTVARRHGVAPGPAGARMVEAAEGETAVHFVQRQAAEHDLAWVVAPETGGVLAGLQARVPSHAWLGCERSAIELTTGKRATLLRLAGRNIATPLAFEHAVETVRWVVKPDDGAGGVDTRVHARRDAAWAAARRGASGAAMVVEPWVDGEPLSVSLLCTAARAELLSVNRQQVSIDQAGLLRYDGVQVNALPLGGEQGRALQLLVARVHQAVPGLRGFVGIDLVWHAARGPVVIEINPRVTCAYAGLSAALGRNLAADILAAAPARAELADAAL